MNKWIILLIEDEQVISRFISAALSSEDYQVVRAASAKEGMLLASSRRPDLILLDLGLPDMDGMELLRDLRSWSDIPVIVVSARTHEREKVEALDMGADDYITKPFGTSELLARIRTALRHSRNKLPEGTNRPSKIVIGELTLDNEKRKVTKGDKTIHLTPIEYKIIDLLSVHVGKVLTHDFIMREVWGPYNVENQILRVNMANLRRKIEDNPGEPRYLITELGVGYRMSESP